MSRLCPICGSAFTEVARRDLIAEHFGTRLHIPLGVEMYVCSQTHFFLDGKNPPGRGQSERKTSDRHTNQ